MKTLLRTLIEALAWLILAVVVSGWLLGLKLLIDILSA